MTTVCIIGAGELGGAVAHALALGERVARVVLIDSSAPIAAGKALDIQQSGAIDGFHTRLSGTDDVTRAIGCAVCVVADRAGQKSTEWQGDEGLARLVRAKPYVADAPIVFAGAAQMSLMTAAAREIGVRRERLIGSATEAFAAAVTAIVAVEARCSPSEVRVAILGAPPAPAADLPARAAAGLIVAWSEASIGGYALEHVLTQAQIARLEARVARLWPPGPYALGGAAASLVSAIVTSSRRAFNVLSVLGGEFGVRGRVGSLPALLAPHGIAHLRVPTLNARERVQLETALGS